MNNIVFSPSGWEEYLEWQLEDRKTLRRINQLLKDVSRSPFEGIGKPEALKYCPGYWSRRIDEKNRLVYAVTSDDDILVLSCKGHYKDLKSL